MTDIHRRTRAPAPDKPLFYTVPEVARILRVSPMTLYRSIAANEFPAVQVRTRLLVPAKLVDRMIDAAMEEGGVLNIAEWRRYLAAS